ncbi:MAG: ABC transporter permease [Rhodothermales bacterium]
MLKNYFKISLRNLKKQKGYSFINITGLAVGMACCLLIALFVRDELSYDRYHDHADRVFRISRAWYDEAGQPTLQFAMISPAIGPTLEEEMPEVRHAVRLGQFGSLVSYEDQHFREPRFFFAEAALFELFTIPFVQGDASTALTEPYTVVLTEAMAEKYFGADDPIGKVLRLNDTFDLRVTGVVENAPTNTHFHYDFLASFATLTAQPWAAGWATTWGSNNSFPTYVLLEEGADPAALEAKFPAFLDRHYVLHHGASSKIFLQPVSEIHLHSHLDAELEPNGNVTYVYLFTAIALFILLIACFNFMNLATARATKRAREVGLRKVLGAERKQLVGQFLGESTLLTLVALVFAAMLAELFLPAFNTLAGKELQLFGNDVPFVLLGLAGIALFTGLVAGCYPAFFLSAFQPAVVLKNATGGAWRSRVRTALVVTQFAISIVLIVGVGIIVKQLNYVQTKSLGFDEDQIVIVRTTRAMRQDFEAFRTRLLEHPGVLAVTASEAVPSGQLRNSINVQADVGGQIKPFDSLPLLAVDHDFTKTYGMDIVAGRAFSKDIASDSTQAFVLNESAVRRLGWASAEEAVGKFFMLESENLRDRRGQVIGVVKDFHFESLHERVTPLVMYIRPALYWRAAIKIAAADMPETLGFLEARWQEYVPEAPLSYSFIDQRFAQLYQAEERFGKVVSYFAALAIMIACLGLFGLASFAAEQRTKEVGVRKVLGASVGGIVLLLSKDFTRVVLIAFLVACPLAYLAMNQWLDTFAYRIGISWWIFLGAGLATLAIALATVSYQAIRVALADPVKALRYE